MNTYNEYDAQANAFLERNGIRFRATLSDTKTPQWADGDKHGHHYRITLSRGGPLVCSASYKRIVFDFWGSVNDAEKLKRTEEALVNMNLQIRNTEPHLRVNLTELRQRLSTEVDACHPSAYDILACISGDVHCPDTFEDFCGEYGYESDSIKALQTFRRCSAFAKRLRAFFTPSEIQELSEIQ